MATFRSRHMLIRYLANSCHYAFKTFSTDLENGLWRATFGVVPIHHFKFSLSWFTATAASRTNSVTFPLNFPLNPSVLCFSWSQRLDLLYLPLQLLSLPTSSIYAIKTFWSQLVPWSSLGVHSQFNDRSLKRHEHSPLHTGERAQAYTFGMGECAPLDFPLSLSLL